MRQKISSLIVLVTTCAVLLLGAGANAQRRDQNVFAITNAKIAPISGPVVERGTVVIRDGKIAAVGANVSVPSGAQVINAQGLWVYPGMIDANTTVGLTEIGQVAATNDMSEIGEFNPQLKAIVAINPESEIIPVTRVNGITTVVTMPRGGLLSGQAALMNLDGWTWEEMMVKSPIGIPFNFPSLGGGGGRGFGGGGQFGQQVQRSFEEVRRQRDEQVNRVKKLFDDARAYLKAKGAPEVNGNHRVDPVLESLIPVVRGEVPLIVSADTARDIRAAIEFADDQKVKIIITGGDESPKVAKLLKEKNIPVILGSVLSLPRGADAPYDGAFTIAKELAEAGVKFAFGTGDAAYVRNLPYHAAMAVAFGLSRDEAVKAVTITPAEILGVADRLGSLDVGKIANVVVWDGDPLEIRSNVRHLFINGKQVPLTTKHTELYQKYLNRP
jgi:imidazolonepropionase-like amidohydrolase